MAVLHFVILSLGRVPRKFVFVNSDRNQAVQAQKMTRGVKFQFKEEEGLGNQCSENNDADQLRGYREADLRLCFRIFNKQVSS